MPQLDGLRAVAFVAVALSHWIPEEQQLDIPLGTGVQLFFVLSGFLITGILLRARPSESGVTLGSTLKTFYARRSLRIFPLYYLVLAVCLIFGVGVTRETWPWHTFYLSNFYYAWHNHGGALVDPLSHFWSLGVEEQFYLFWPLVALTIDRRRLAPLIITAIVTSLIFRIEVGFSWENQYATRYLTPSCLDALGIGALAAYARHYHGVAGLRRVKFLCAVVGLAGLVLTIAIKKLFGFQLAHWVGHSCLIIFYGAVVAQAGEGFKGLLGWLLNAPPVRYLGRISYGLYVYHHFMPLVFVTLFAKAGIEAGLGLTTPFNLIPYFALTILVAAVSWHCYEEPILRLKRRFDYRNARVRGAPLPAPVAIPPAP